MKKYKLVVSNRWGGQKEITVESGKEPYDVLRDLQKKSPSTEVKSIELVR